MSIKMVPMYGMRHNKNHQPDVRASLQIKYKLAIGTHANQLASVLDFWAMR